MAKKMKGIELCGDCLHYNNKKHCCKLGAHKKSDPRSPFYDDCPLPNAEPVVHSHWEVAIGYDHNKKVQCQNCFLMAHEPTRRCPHCGAHMDEEVDNGTFG